MSYNWTHYNITAKPVSLSACTCVYANFWKGKHMSSNLTHKYITEKPVSLSVYMCVFAIHWADHQWLNSSIKLKKSGLFMEVWTSTSMHSFPKYNIRETLASLFDHSLYINLGGLNNLLQGSAQTSFWGEAFISLRTKIHKTVLEKIAFYSIYYRTKSNFVLFMKQENYKA